PRTYHPLVDRIDEAMLYAGLDRAREQLAGFVGQLPTQQQFIDAHCRAERVDLARPAMAGA
ncbi:tryptophan halogenase, partial [Escherichia coli]|nr:tryptophan halogenase [Escherichia coli]